MKIFELQFNDWDETNIYQLVNDTKSDVEFEDDVQHILDQMAVTELPDGRGSWIGVPEILSFVNSKLLLMGYRKLETYTYNFPGSSILQEGDDVERLTEIIGADKVKSIIKYNTDLENDLFKIK